jgi:hypothetical protein
MGFVKPNLPAVEPQEFLQRPLMERMKILALNWVENGFGAPRMVHVIYLTKLALFYALGGVVVATLTSRLSPWQVADWWNQPVVYQKMVIWTMLLESMGLAGSWGPLAGKFKPMTGGLSFWTRPGNIRLRPFRWVPFTNGDRRTVGDVALYVGFLASMLTLMVLPGVPSDTLSRVLIESSSRPAASSTYPR